MYPSVQFDRNGGSQGGVGNVRTTYYVSRDVHSKSEVWAKAPEDFSARSTMGASKLHCQTEGVCDEGSRAHPPQKEKAPVAYERIIGRQTYSAWLGAIGRSDCVWLDTSGHIARARRACMQKRCVSTCAKRGMGGAMRVDVC